MWGLPKGLVAIKVFSTYNDQNVIQNQAGNTSEVFLETLSHVAPNDFTVVLVLSIQHKQLASHIPPHHTRPTNAAPNTWLRFETTAGFEL